MALLYITGIVVRLSKLTCCDLLPFCRIVYRAFWGCRYSSIEHFLWTGVVFMGLVVCQSTWSYKWVSRRFIL